MSTFFTLFAALFCLLTRSTAQPDGTVAAQCTVQVFGDLMQYGKGIRVTTFIPFPWMNYLHPATHTAAGVFGPEKASANLLLPIQGVTLQNRHITIQFTAGYRCHFDSVLLSNVHAAGTGTGKCFRISQRCGHVTSTYGKVYIDMWCNLPYQPSYTSGVTKMNYSSQGPEVGC